MRFEPVPMELADANEYVRLHHRHHPPVVGHKFSLGAMERDKGLVGVAIVGRPVARRNDDGWTLEITRLCTDGTPHACSFLYAAAWRAGRALGYRRMGTFIGKDEPGTSLKAAGWRLVSETPGRSWSVPSRPRMDKHPLQGRLYYEAPTPPGEER